MSRKFEAVPAVRKAVPLLIGIAGPPGSGKTYSALRLAAGITAHRGGRPVAIDTERNRMLAYAPPSGVKADGINHFDFLHVPFAPPFASADFLDAVLQQRAHRPSCIIVDSFSDEHEGEGGLLDFHDKELDRMAGDDWGKRERMTQAAWIKPKQKRLAMMNGLFQLMVPIIFCYRAREKTKQIKNDRGKMEPTNIGWTPIAPPEIVHNMTLFALLPVKSDGVPMWKGNTAYEDFSIKLPQQFKNMFPAEERISERMGFAMSEWALGDQKLSDIEGPAAEEEKQPPRQRAAKAAEQPVENAAAPGPSAEPASPASGDGMATAAGAPGSGEPTTALDPEAGGPEAEEGRPTPTASAPAAEAGQASSDSATDASTASPPEASGPMEGQPPSSAAAPETNGIPAAFAAFAEVLAGATEWPNTIAPALAVLRKEPAWTAAPEEQRVRLHTMAFARLQELIHEGYRFDFTDDLHAYRCYIDQEWDLDALEGHVRVVTSTRNPKWIDLPTAAKIAFDKAVDAAKKRIAERAAGGPGAEFS